MEERTLIQMLLRRDDQAISMLELHYGPLIRYIITPILPDKRDRDEVFSDILLRVWERIDRFDPAQGSWTGWLAVLSRNAAIDRLRRVPPSSGEIPETLPASDPDPEGQLLLKERRQALLNGIRTLTYEEQTIFCRKYYYRQSTGQIASEYGTTERAIEGRLYRIRKKLQKQLGGGFLDE